LVLSVGAAFLIEYLDDTIKSPDDAMTMLKLTPLGAIARIKGEGYEDKLVTATHPRSPISESYRTLRTNIQFSTLDKPARTLLVTSPNPIEGKSITAANLAVAMAQAGLRTVLVDSDLRRPAQHKIFSLSNQQGLTTSVLEEEPVLDGHLQAVSVENLRVLTSGPIPPNPSELLGSHKMQVLLERLKAESDIVIFDSPPALAVTDAAVLSTQVDAVLLVTDAGRTRRDMALRARDDLLKVGAHILGVAVNRLSGRMGGYYYYYYYYSRDDGSKQKRHHEHHRVWWQRFPPGSWLGSDSNGSNGKK
jgi:non-specific protein-tyrosine kinase